MDPKSFYNEAMPQKYGSDYEAGRWRATPLLAAQYDMLADMMRREVVPLVRGAKRVVEVGPGPGTWTKLLLEVNSDARYTLVDISEEMLAQARKGLAGHSNVVFVESDLLALESSQTFDFFFSSRSIEYMPDKHEACRKIASLLAPGAQGALVTKMPKPLFDRLRDRSTSALHKGQISPAQLSRLLSEAGVFVERARIATATVPGFGSAALNRLAYAALKRIPLFFPFTLFAESYLVTFRRPL